MRGRRGATPPPPAAPGDRMPLPGTGGGAAARRDSASPVEKGSRVQPGGCGSAGPPGAAGPGSDAGSGAMLPGGSAGKCWQPRRFSGAPGSTELRCPPGAAGRCGGSAGSRPSGSFPNAAGSPRAGREDDCACRSVRNREPGGISGLKVLILSSRPLPPNFCMRSPSSLRVVSRVRPGLFGAS